MDLAATVDLPANSHNVLLLSAPDTCMEMPSADYARQFFPEAKINM